LILASTIQAPSITREISVNVGPLVIQWYNSEIYASHASVGRGRYIPDIIIQYLHAVMSGEDIRTASERILSHKRGEISFKLSDLRAVRLLLLESEIFEVGTKVWFRIRGYGERKRRRGVFGDGVAAEGVRAVSVVQPFVSNECGDIHGLYWRVRGGRGGLQVVVVKWR